MHGKVCKNGGPARRSFRHPQKKPEEGGASKRPLPPVRRGLTKGTVGYLRTLSAVSSPLIFANLLDRFSIKKRYLIAPRINFLDILRNFVLRSLVTPQFRPKVSFFFLSAIAGFTVRSSRMRLKRSRRNSMNRV